MTKLWPPPLSPHRALTVAHMSATSSGDGLLRVWDLLVGKCIDKFLSCTTSRRIALLQSQRVNTRGVRSNFQPPDVSFCWGGEQRCQGKRGDRFTHGPGQHIATMQSSSRCARSGRRLKHSVGFSGLKERVGLPSPVQWLLQVRDQA